VTETSPQHPLRRYSASLRAKLALLTIVSALGLTVALYATYELNSVSHYHAITFDRLAALESMKSATMRFHMSGQKADLDLTQLRSGFQRYQQATRACVEDATPAGRVVLSLMPRYDLLAICRADLERLQAVLPALGVAELAGTSAPVAEQIVAALDQFEANASDLGDPVKRVGNVIAFTLTAVFAAFGSIVLILTVLLLVNTNPVLARLKQVTDRFAAGDFQVKVTDIHRQDELGSIARSLKRLKQAEMTRRETEARLRDLSDHDVLTGLANARRLRERLDQALVRSLALDHQVALVRVDLMETDAYRRLAEACSADRILVEAAERLRLACPHALAMARLEGWHFAVAETGRRASEVASVTAARILQRFKEPFSLGEEAVTLEAVAGIEVCSGDQDSAETLLTKAGQALSLGLKRAGPGRAYFFDEAHYVDLQQELALKHDLSHAVARQELLLYLQPQAACTKGCGLIGFEALLRWDRGQGEMVSPGKFIPMAEDMGIIDEIGLWVLQAACEHAADWPQPLSISVNLSPRQFSDPVMLDQVRDVLQHTSLPPNRLTLEITESVFMEAKAEARAKFSAIKALGCQIALDDFGTGFSSLAYIRDLAFDKIKVDRSFITDLVDNGRAREILRSIIQLGDALNSPVIAEGVETPEQLDTLRTLGCDIIQGYLLDWPQPADEAIARHLMETQSAESRRAVLNAGD